MYAHLTMAESIHDPLLDDLIRRRGVVMVVGAPDTGKSSLARRLVDAALQAGKTAAYVDADIDQTTIGPPACVGLKVIRGQEDLEEMSRPDALQFVGSISVEPVVLQQVAATATLVGLARDQADLVVLDTTGAISGVVGQTLKYHKMEVCRPEVVVALQRGAELEPLVGMLRRFFSADVEIVGVDPSLRSASPEDRRSHREKAFAAAFAEPLHRWRVRNTVFAPTLPAGLDVSRLDGVLVGLQDGRGACLGLGALTHDDGTIRVVTNAGEGMRGLRLGSLRIDLDTFGVEPVRLRELMFGI
jgi:polynucleotide 5'-kinase involved in rRNA processing